MRTTIDLPDEFLTEVKVEAARQRKKLNRLVPELIRVGLNGARRAAPDNRWLHQFSELGRQATEHLRDGPTATEILCQDRSRSRSTAIC